MNTRTDFPALDQSGLYVRPEPRPYCEIVRLRELAPIDANTLLLAIEGWLALDCCRAPDFSVGLVRVLEDLDNTCEECGGFASVPPLCADCEEP
jgi:hypothetical protein